MKIGNCMSSKEIREEWARRDAAMGAEITGAEVGRVLRLARKRRGLSLAQVAEISDGQFKEMTVRAWESGDRRPSVPQVSALLAWYDVGYQIVITDNPGAASFPILSDELTSKEDGS